MRADRLLTLLALLQNHRRLTAAEAAGSLGVSVRTVQRDIDVLSSAGIPVYAERGRGGGLRLREGFTTRLAGRLGLSRDEAEALAVLHTPSILADLHIDGDFTAALEKIAAAVPAVHQLHARHARDRLMVDTVPWFRQGAPAAALACLDALRRAVWSNSVCSIDYQRGDGVRKRYRVEPYSLAAKVDLWYLVGQTKDGMRVFRLSRILRLEVTDNVYVRDPDFDLRRFWKRWCRRFESEPLSSYWVTLSLTHAGRDRLLERYGGWHARALDRWDEARVHNVVRLDLENEEMAVRILFDLGGEARVVEPERLRRAVRARALAVAEGA